MEHIYRMVNIGGKRRKISLFEPESLQVLDPNFSYASYIEDIIALKQGIFQGFFADLEDINLSLDEISYQEVDNETRKKLFDLDRKYRQDINHMQKVYEEGLANGEDKYALNEIITRNMKRIASNYMRAVTIIERFNTASVKKSLPDKTLDVKNDKAKKRLFRKMNQVNWIDIPIEEIDFTRLDSKKRLAYYKLRSLPNTPDDYLKYTVRELAYMNEPYISRKGPKK